MGINSTIVKLFIKLPILKSLLNVINNIYFINFLMIIKMESDVQNVHSIKQN